MKRGSLSCLKETISENTTSFFPQYMEAVCDEERERESERARETERQRETQRYRQRRTERQTERQTDRQIDGGKEGWHREKDRRM